MREREQVRQSESATSNKGTCINTKQRNNQQTLNSPPSSGAHTQPTASQLRGSINNTVSPATQAIKAAQTERGNTRGGGGGGGRDK